MKKRFTAGVLLAIFTFLFLETEYLFVNIMGTLSNSRQAVSTQGIVLGVSVIGFLLYALFQKKFINLQCASGGRTDFKMLMLQNSRKELNNLY